MELKAASYGRETLFLEDLCSSEQQSRLRVSSWVTKQLTHYQTNLLLGYPPIFGQHVVEMTVDVIKEMAPIGGVTLVFLPGMEEITQVQEQLELLARVECFEVFRKSFATLQG